MVDLATRVVKQQIVKEPIAPTGDNNPTQIRYGWNPFKELNLCGPDGTIAIPAQPHEIAGADGRPVPNPYHRKLPKGQLIPFPTFNIVEQTPSHDVRDSSGRAALVSTTRAVPALEAVIRVSRAYGDKGFTQLRSLQGLEQEQAQRIFTVVQPFDYPIGRLLDELNFGAEERIEAEDELVFDLGNGDEYVVDCLRNDKEREIARQLVAEMLIGADVAFQLADETLNATNTSITTRFAGGQGKVGPDAHDRYLESEEVGQVVSPLKSSQPDNSNLERKVDFLVNKEIDREKDAEIERLRRENEELKAGSVAKPAMETVQIIYCGFPKVDNSGPCQVPVKNEGDRCPHHREREVNES